MAESPKFSRLLGNRGHGTRWWRQILDRKCTNGRFAHAQYKIRYITLIYGRIAKISTSYRKSGSRNTMVTPDFRPEMEIWPSYKILSRLDKGFRFYGCAISSIKLFTWLFVCFLGVLQIHCSQDARTDFDAKYIKRRVPHKDVPFGGVAKPKVKLYTPFCSKNLHLWDLEIFAQKRL